MAVWPGENVRAESDWPPDSDENNWQYSLIQTSDGPAEKFWSSDWGSPNGKMSEEMRPTELEPEDAERLPASDRPAVLEVTGADGGGVGRGHHVLL